MLNNKATPNTAVDSDGVPRHVPTAAVVHLAAGRDNAPAQSPGRRRPGDDDPRRWEPPGRGDDDQRRQLSVSTSRRAGDDTQRRQQSLSSNRRADDERHQMSVSASALVRLPGIGLPPDVKPPPVVRSDRPRSSPSDRDAPRHTDAPPRAARAETPPPLRGSADSDSTSATPTPRKVTFQAVAKKVGKKSGKRMGGGTEAILASLQEMETRLEQRLRNAISSSSSANSGGSFGMTGSVNLASSLSMRLRESEHNAALTSRVANLLRVRKGGAKTDEDRDRLARKFVNKFSVIQRKRAAGEPEPTPLRDSERVATPDAIKDGARGFYASRKGGVVDVVGGENDAAWPSWLPQESYSETTPLMRIADILYTVTATFSCMLAMSPKAGPRPETDPRGAPKVNREFEEVISGAKSGPEARN